MAGTNLWAASQDPESENYKSSSRRVVCLPFCILNDVKILLLPFSFCGGGGGWQPTEDVKHRLKKYLSTVHPRMTEKREQKW
jgi:hypothetical protein